MPGNDRAPSARGSLFLSVRLLLALVVPVVVVAGVSAPFFPLTARQIDLTGGQGVFRERCASCHSLEPAATPGIGPNLGRIGRIAASRRPGMNAAQYILESIVSPAAFKAPGTQGDMPVDAGAGLTERHLLQLVAFLCSRGARPNYRDLLALDLRARVPVASTWQAVDLPAVERGWKIFTDTAQCGRCHSLYAEPGGDLRAPSLARAGLTPREELRQSIEDPSARISPGYSQVTVRTKHGERVTGRMVSRSDSGIVLYVEDESGEVNARALSKDEIVLTADGSPDLEADPLSPMPSFSLAENDLGDLLQFLGTLKGSSSSELE